MGWVALVAMSAAGCGSAAAGEPSSTTAATEASQPVPMSVPETVEKASPDASDTGEGIGTGEAESRSGTTVEDASLDDSEDALDDGNPFSWSDELAAAQAAMEAPGAIDDVPAPPAGSVDAYLGGSPDAYATAAITLGLEEAGVDLTGITVHVLPLMGEDASLLVMEIGDDYVESGFLTQEEGKDITGALLALPELTSASISELVTVYRGVDEQGPFTMTFVVSIDALAEAYSTDGDVGDALLAQVDRGS